MGDVSGSKYWELPGSDECAKKVVEGQWLPQIIANELHERMLSEGVESVPRGEFMEEACNEEGESVLVLLKPICFARLSFWLLNTASPLLLVGGGRDTPIREASRILLYAPC